MERQAIQIHRSDNVATAIFPLTKGDVIAVSGQDGSKVEIILKTNVPLYHKLSLRPIETGQAILKYGHPIGLAKRDILPGVHVHVSNMENLDRRK
ncbi:UxaA family hydrolase [Ruminococcaceae bacterium OttesenSCG-928-I18]|nr:UxaA family hydrolase [Ruminococcaceae bacterium OttesenSCG-928-I18]